MREEITESTPRSMTSTQVLRDRINQDVIDFKARGGTVEVVPEECFVIDAAARQEYNTSLKNRSVQVEMANIFRKKS